LIWSKANLRPRALANLVLGSVAMKVLARCTVPVLLVR
jgi:nucleotide-binding universal stress UspA family protein